MIVRRPHFSKTSTTTCLTIPIILRRRRFAPTTGAANKCTSIMSLLSVYETTYSPTH
jgi:hypothetical protein